MQYLHRETGGGHDFDDFVAELVAHPRIKDKLTPLQKKEMTPEEVAMLCIAAQLTQVQFDHLCKHSAFVDDRYNSSKLLSQGMKEVGESLPERFFMQNPFPGCCYDPLDYLMAQVEQDTNLFEFREGPLKDAVLVMRKGDGSGDAKFPMFTEVYNCPQMPQCQMVEHCHVVANGRFVESVEGEKVHLGEYYKRWSRVEKKSIMVDGKPKRLVQAYGGDGADLVKKKGTAGFSSEHWCPSCFANKTCKHKISCVNPEIKARVEAYREWEHDACATAGKCICHRFGCAKHLIAQTRAYALKTWPKITMEGGRGEIDANKWDPEHMQHPKHDLIGKHAQDECGGQVQCLFACRILLTLPGAG